MSDLDSSTVVEVQDLKVHFPVTGGVFRKEVDYVRAVDGVSFSIKAGETFSLVGESGCGKSTTAMAILKMQKATEGKVYLFGSDITGLNTKQMRPNRRRMQMVYQDPFGSLNPRMKVGSIIGEPLRVHGLASNREDYQKRVLELMSLVGLLDDMADRYPHEFSGGMRQRVVIALALCAEPELIIADEPTTALDVSVQAQVLDLLKRLCRERGASVMLITHDMGVIAETTDRVAVLYAGRLAEIGPTQTLLSNPKHPYTRGLIASTPSVESGDIGTHLFQIRGTMPRLDALPPGCRFHPRCEQIMARCRSEQPEVAENGAACFLYEDD